MPGARTAPAHPPTLTHPHPCSALELGRVEDRAAAGRARQRAAGCREDVDAVGLPVLAVDLHTVGLRRAQGQQE